MDRKEMMGKALQKYMCPHSYNNKRIYENVTPNAYPHIIVRSKWLFNNFPEIIQEVSEEYLLNSIDNIPDI